MMARGRAASRSGLRPQPGDRSLDDVIVVGAGPAGLAAALYLARYRRSVRVLHDGRSRALLAPLANNVPAFPDGISGRDLLARMQRQAERFGARVCEAHVETLARSERSFEFGLDGGTTLRARGAILATGTEMHLLVLDAGDHDAAVCAGAVRYCPICDGFEHRARDIAVLGSDLHGASEAMFLRQYSHHVTLLAREPMALTPEQRAELAASRVRVLDQRVRAIRHIDGKLAVDVAGEARPLHFDTLYPALGSVPRARLARQVGVICDEDGALPAYGFAEPLLPGLFAAGDVVRGLDQIVVAAGQGALAATRLHNWLRARDRHMLSDQAAANGT